MVETSEKNGTFYTLILATKKRLRKIYFLEPNQWECKTISFE